MLRAVLAGIGVAVAAGPLGCFVVWRRMAYFGDTVAHAAILGVALALAAELPLVAGVGLTALVAGLLVSAMSGRAYASDTLLGVMAHGALACGLVSVALIGSIRVDLTAYLFGDILSVGWSEVTAVWMGAAVISLVIGLSWQRLIVATLSTELAVAAGGDPRRDNLVLTATLAVLIAISLKLVGALLITALLIIPAAAARALARTPEAMAGIAMLFGALSVIVGLQASLVLDTPAGPSIVVTALVIFVLANLIRLVVPER